jgi:hypothetical protein
MEVGWMSETHHRGVSAVSSGGVAFGLPAGTQVAMDLISWRKSWPSRLTSNGHPVLVHTVPETLIEPFGQCSRVKTVWPSLPSRAG